MASVETRAGSVKRKRVEERKVERRVRMRGGKRGERSVMGVMCPMHFFALLFILCFVWFLDL